jgi:ABC-2 type transport system ATP-binding protein
MSSAPFAVEVNQLGKTYRDGWFGKKFQALSGVTLSVRQGEVFGLLGPNGAGKTTLLKILLGIIRKTSGHATMLGMPAGSRAIRNHVGYLPEHLRIPGHHTIFSALELYGNLSNLSNRQIRERREQVIELVGLTGREKEPVKKFSKGMLQRLGLAQALLVRPKMLILDEPTDGLDPRGRAEMRALIMRLKSEGVTVFVNSHILQEVELVCDRVAILDKGILQFCGSVQESAAILKSHSSTIQLNLIVAGLTSEIDSILSGMEVTSSNILPNGSRDLEMNVANQAAVDDLIDRLRAAKLSIISLTPKQASLEEAFLAILDKSAKQ